MDLTPQSADALEREALRVYRRYATEVVERFNICPWAAHARAMGRVAERVLLQDGEEHGPVLEEVENLAARSEVEVGLLIFPRLALARLPFDHFVATLREADAARWEIGSAPFAFAAFHPEAEPRLETGERLIPFLRRTPDPTIQLVRRSILEALHERTPHGTEFVDLEHLLRHGVPNKPEPSLRARIAEENKRTVESFGVEAIRAVFSDIAADRERAYRTALAT